MSVNNRFDMVLLRLHGVSFLRVYESNPLARDTLKREYLLYNHRWKGGRIPSRNLRRKNRISKGDLLSPLSSKALYTTARSNRSFHSPECKELLAVSLHPNIHPLSDPSYVRPKILEAIPKEDIVEVEI